LLRTVPCKICYTVHCQVMEVTHSSFEVGPEFRLQMLLEIGMVDHKEEIEEITEGADKQLKIQLGLRELVTKWSAETFVFAEWKGRGVNVLKGTGLIMEVCCC
jgi:dynein heavy chain, axonemal